MFYQQTIGAYSGSILNLPERDYLRIRRASFIRSAKISFVESDFIPVDVPFRTRLVYSTDWIKRDFHSRER